jgi:hypothetical protein
MASDEAIYLNKQDRRILQELIRKGRAGNGSKRPTPTRRIPRGAGVAGNIIRATVNEPLGVLSGDPTFSVDNAVAIVGSAPSDGTATAQNTYSEAFADNEPVLLFQRRDNGNWETEKSGGSSYTPVVLFQLTQDKAYGDTAKLAKPLNAAGTIDSGADPIYVLDADAKFYAKSGAILVTEDHADGIPGYRIITLWGPAYIMAGVLTSSYSGGGTTFNPASDEIYGRPFRGDRLPSSGDITVYDDLNVADSAKNGEAWYVIWNETQSRYTFFARVGEQYVTIKGTSPGVTRATATFTLGSPSAVNGPVPSGTITVTNDPPMDAPSGETVYARFNVGVGTGTLITAWDTGDGGNFIYHLRGLADWNTSDDQVIDHDGDVDPHWHGTGPCEPPP